MSSLPCFLILRLSGLLPEDACLVVRAALGSSPAISPQGFIAPSTSGGAGSLAAAELEHRTDNAKDYGSTGRHRLDTTQPDIACWTSYFGPYIGRHMLDIVHWSLYDGICIRWTSCGRHRIRWISYGSQMFQTTWDQTCSGRSKHKHCSRPTQH